MKHVNANIPPEGTEVPVAKKRTSVKKPWTPKSPYEPKKPSRRQKQKADVRELELANPIPFPQLEGISAEKAKALIGTWKAKRKAALIDEAAKNPSMSGALIKAAYSLSGKKTKNLAKVKALVRRARKKLNSKSVAAAEAGAAHLAVDQAATPSGALIPAAKKG